MNPAAVERRDADDGVVHEIGRINQGASITHGSGDAISQRNRALKRSPHVDSFPAAADFSAAAGPDDVCTAILRGRDPVRDGAEIALARVVKLTSITCILAIRVGHDLADLKTLERSKK
jgi:hypothetical protein